MLRKIGVFILALACVLMLAACGCEHVWLEATCQAPATCELCAKTEGELGDHIWQDATCTAPKTCATCGATEGEKLQHKMVEATCELPAACVDCDYMEGEPLGHSWKKSKCTATCEICGADDPSAPGHVLHDATCRSPQWCEVCHMEFGEAADHAWVEANCDTAKQCQDCKLYEGVALGHTLAEGGDGITGICTTCNKAVEYYFSGASGQTLYAWTTYDVAADGSYTNPVSYLIADWKDDNGFRRYQTINWFDNGNLKNYQASKVRDNNERPKAFYEAYYAAGKVYYFTAYSANNENAVLRALMKAAAKHVSFVTGTTNATKPTNVVLSGSGGLFADTKGYVDAAYDAYGNPFAIVHNPDTGETWAEPCNWQQ